MNKDFAWKLVRQAIKAGSTLTSELHSLKANSTPEEYTYFRSVFGRIAGEISDEIVSKLLNEFPEFRKSIEMQLEQKGQLE